MTCPACSKPLGNDRFCIGPLTAPHPAVYPREALIARDREIVSRSLREARELGQFLRK